jgi:hypothetical protein
LDRSPVEADATVSATNVIKGVKRCRAACCSIGEGTGVVELDDGIVRSEA